MLFLFLPLSGLADSVVPIDEVEDNVNIRQGTRNFLVRFSDTGYIMHNRASTLTIGAYVSAGGVWTNSSSRDKKENIATSERDALSTMDIVAVLTRVVQEQQIKINELEARLDAL